MSESSIQAAGDTASPDEQDPAYRSTDFRPLPGGEWAGAPAAVDPRLSGVTVVTPGTDGAPLVVAPAGPVTPPADWHGVSTPQRPTTGSSGVTVAQVNTLIAQALASDPYLVQAEVEEIVTNALEGFEVPTIDPAEIAAQVEAYFLANPPTAVSAVDIANDTTGQTWAWEGIAPSNVQLAINSLLSKLTEVVSDYVVDADLDGLLTSADLTAALSDYVTSAVLSTALATKASPTDITTAIAAIPSGGADATPALRALGTSSGQALPGNHASVTNARTPTAHASSHADGGADELALDASQVTTGHFAVARLASGTPDGTKFVADDGTLKAPASGGGVSLSDGTPAALGSAAAGSSGTASRSDHVHALPTATALGLGNVTNTSDANKPVSTAQQTALDLKANLASPTFTGTVGGITKSMVGLGNVDNTADASKTFTESQITNLTTDLAAKAPIASPTFTGTVSGVSKSMVGLGNVDNTADASKTFAASQVTSGVFNIARLATGTPDGTKFVRDDGTLVTPTAGGGSNISFEDMVAGDHGTFVDQGEWDSATTYNTFDYVWFLDPDMIFLATTDGLVTDDPLTPGTGWRLVAQSAAVYSQFATAAAFGSTAVQPGSLATVATTGAYSDLTGTPTLGTAAATASTAYATAAQGAVADTAVQPGDLAPVATSGAYGDLTSKPTLGSLAALSTVTSSEITNGTIVDADINGSAAIAQSKIASLTTDLAAKAATASPTFTGTPAAPTAAAATSTTQLATTAFVTTADNLKADLASPTFTGTPSAPTASAATSTTQLATTAFVTTADNLKANLASPTFTGTPLSTTAAQGTNTTQIATTAMVQSEVTLLAPKASPALTGTPTSTTAAQGTNTTQIATTAMVQSEVALLKTILPRVTSLTGSQANPTFNTGSFDILEITGLSGTITSFTTNLSGTASKGRKIEIWITDNGGAQTITAFGASFTAPYGTSFPTTTIAGKKRKLLFEGNGTVWELTSIVNET